ncbi:MAG: LysM peptidoglycan-binding domain-containing protein [Anaerotignum sp.]
MNSDKNGNLNSNTDLGSRANGNNDKEYYEDLYSDLPKEVVDVLMQTHPLMNKDTTSTQATRAKRRSEREDVEEVKEARMQQVGNEIDEIRRAPQQEGEPTRYVSRSERKLGMGNNVSATGHKMEEDEHDDGIQYVSVMPPRKKSKMVEEVSQQTMMPSKRKKEKKEDNLFEEFTSHGRGRYEEFDFEEKAKQQHLDNLYDEYEDEDEYVGGMNKLTMILGGIGLVLIVFLIFRCVSLGSQLVDAENQVAAGQELSTKYEAVQLEKMKLEEELATLQSGGTTGDATTTDADGEEESVTASSSNTGSSTASGSTEYVVVEGDTAWSIAEKTLGNGAEYQKILDANNLKETDTIDIGRKLTIPKS